MDKKRVIIDTDPGVDDINAMLFAFLCDQFEIEAITTVHGNVNVDIGTTNALHMVEHFSGKEVPVYRGAEQGLFGDPMRDAAILHGEDGMGNTGLARPTIRRRPEPAASAMVDIVMNSPGEITLLVLGPQTNVALAIRSEPDFAAAVKEIVFMGGRITPRADTNPFVTFNIGEDPEAAWIVIQESGIPVTMLGQETAMAVMFDHARLDRFAASGTAAGRFAAEVTRYYVSKQISLLNQTAGSIPDIAVMAYALRPDLFDQRQLRIDVDTSDGPTRGATISGTLPYFKVDGLKESLKERPVEAGESEKNVSVAEHASAQFARTINVPSKIDHTIIEDWYEELLTRAPK